MGALTKKERDALEDVFISIHTKSKYEQLCTSFQSFKLKSLAHIRLNYLKGKKHTIFFYNKYVKK